MVKATWNNQLLAQSDNTIQLEGNEYFPPDSIKKEFFSHNNKTTTCPWKGELIIMMLRLTKKQILLVHGFIQIQNLTLQKLKDMLRSGMVLL